MRIWNLSDARWLSVMVAIVVGGLACDDGARLMATEDSVESEGLALVARWEAEYNRLLAENPAVRAMHRYVAGWSAHGLAPSEFLRTWEPPTGPSRCANDLINQGAIAAVAATIRARVEGNPSPVGVEKAIDDYVALHALEP